MKSPDQGESQTKVHRSQPGGTGAQAPSRSLGFPLGDRAGGVGLGCGIRDARLLAPQYELARPERKTNTAIFPTRFAMTAASCACSTSVRFAA